MVGEIELRHREDQPMLVVRRRVRHAGIQPALADAFPQVYEYAVRSGAGLAGPPTCGYRAETTRYEAYLTDTGQYTNPEDWRTEILAPIAG
jgi:hypothetical protein